MVRNRPPIDLIARIQTPENIEFEYRLAGPFRRVPAYVLDILIRSLIIFAVWFLLAIVLGMLQSGRGLAIGGFSSDFGMFLVVVFQFLLQWFYGAFFETYWNGQTPGKRIFGIRVISVDGRPINATQAIVRNLIRTADMIPTGIIGLVCASLTERFQRLGDLAAGTMVVLNEVSWVPSNIRFDDPRVASLSEFIPANFRLTPTMAKAIALFAERRPRIPMSRRIELASYIARPLLKRFGFRDDTSADLLLCAIYYREFIVKDAFSTEKPRNSIPIGAAPFPVTSPTPVAGQPIVPTATLVSGAVPVAPPPIAPPLPSPPNVIGR